MFYYYLHFNESASIEIHKSWHTAYLHDSLPFCRLQCHRLLAGSGEGETRRELDAAADPLRTAGFEVVASIEPGHADEVIAGMVEKAGIDLLVMGAYGHSQIGRAHV